MKQLYVSLLCIIVSFHLAAQCNTSASIEMDHTYGCVGIPFTTHAVVTTDCAGPYVIHYDWDLIRYFNTSTIQMPEAHVGGEVMHPDSIPSFVFTGSIDATYRVYISVAVIDINGDTLASTMNWSQGIVLSNSLTVWTDERSDNCFDIINCRMINYQYAVEPVQILWDGELLDSRFVCDNVSAYHSIQVTDATGCVGEAVAYTWAAPVMNTICERATALTSGVMLEDTLCNTRTTEPVCHPIQYYGGGEA